MTDVKTSSNVPAETNVTEIPFPKTFKQLNESELKACKNDITKLKSAENLSVELINRLTPALIEHVLGGGNVTVINQMMEALHKSRREKVLIFLRRHFGHEYDKDTQRFGKRKAAGPFKKACEQYAEFLGTGQTVMGWIDLNTRTEPIEFNAERATRSFYNRMTKNGIDVQGVIRLLTACAEADAQKAKTATA